MVKGIAVSNLFHCATEAACGTSQIEAGLKEIKGLGVSTFFPVHKFDNAFGAPGWMAARSAC